MLYSKDNIRSEQKRAGATMNYISQLNAFYELLPSNPLSSKAICLYSVLLHINNKCLWKVRFTVANTYLVMLTGIDRRTLDRIRNELIQKKYIEYKKGSGSQAGEYRIIPLYVQNDTQNNLCVQNDIQFVTQNDTQSVTQLDHINKLNKTIYLSLIEKTHARYPLPRNSAEILAAQAYARSLDEWKLIPKEEQFRIISLV